jgi:hypothetical protein
MLSVLTHNVNILCITMDIVLKLKVTVLSVIMQGGVIMLIVNMLNVVMLSVIIISL